MDRDATKLLSSLARLRRRVSMIEGIAAVPAAALSAASVWAVARGFGLAVRAPGPTLAGVAAVALAVIVARVVARRPSLPALALRLDRELRSSELIVSAFETSNRADSVARVVRRQALVRLADPAAAQVLRQPWPVARLSGALILAGGVAIAGGDLLAWRLEAARIAEGDWQKRVGGSALGEEDAPQRKVREEKRVDATSGADSSESRSPERPRPEAARKRLEAAGASVEEGSSSTDPTGRDTPSPAASASRESPEPSREARAARASWGAASQREIANEVAGIAPARSGADPASHAQRNRGGDPLPGERDPADRAETSAVSGPGSAREGRARELETKGVKTEPTAETRADSRGGTPTRATVEQSAIPAGFAEYLRRYVAVARELEGRR